MPQIRFSQRYSSVSFPGLVGSAEKLSPLFVGREKGTLFFFFFLGYDSPLPGNQKSEISLYEIGLERLKF